MHVVQLGRNRSRGANTCNFTAPEYVLFLSLLPLKLCSNRPNPNTQILPAIGNIEEFPSRRVFSQPRGYNLFQLNANFQARDYQNTLLWFQGESTNTLNLGKQIIEDMQVLQLN